MMLARCVLAGLFVFLMIVALGFDGAESTSTSVWLTATVEPVGPIISGLRDQTIQGEDEFPTISLDEYVSDAHYLPRELTWSYSGNEEMNLHISFRRKLTVSVPDAEWVGSEVIRLEVCNPDHLCDSTELTFTVRDRGTPIISLADQFIFPGEGFAPIALDEHVRDSDHALDEIIWAFSGNVNLEATIADHVLMVNIPDEWIGSETISLEACDPDGLCDTQEVVFAVLGESDVLLMYINNAGFMVTTGGKKVLIDALFNFDGMITPETVSLMENALPPFDGVDLILATHSDGDHFNAEVVVRHMENNPDAVFVSTERTVNLLRSYHERVDDFEERVVPVQLGEGESMQLPLNGIDLEAIFLPHGPGGIPNLGFIITIGERRFFHTGDWGADVATLPAIQVYDLSSKQIDVAFIARYLLTMSSYESIVREGIQAGHIVPIHPATSSHSLAVSFPEAIFFNEELERRMIS